MVCRGTIDNIADSNYSIIALRFATACGWSPNFRADLVLNDFVLTAMLEKEISVLSDGTPWRPLIHVKDIAMSILWAIESDLYHFLVSNVGSNDWTLTIGDSKKVSEILEVPYEIKNENFNDKRREVNLINFQGCQRIHPNAKFRNDCLRN